jgi:hypothetical protein
MAWIFFLGLIVTMVIKPKTAYFLIPIGLLTLLVVIS